MKKLIPLSLLCLFLFGISTTQAQTAEQPVGFKLMFGTNSYDGDLGNELLEFANDDYMYGFGLSYYLSPAFDLGLDFKFMTLDKYNGPDDTVFGKRDTEFETNNFNANLMLRWKPLVGTELNPYLAAGVGGNFMKDGSDVREEDYHFAFSIPFGIGVNYELKDNVMLNVEAIYNRTFSDEIDNYPLDSDDLSAGVDASNYGRNIDDKDHDDYMTMSVGVVYTFGGEDHMSMEERLLRQSMENLEAAEQSSDEASETLNQAQELNDETLAALEELRNAINQMPKESEDLKAEMVRVVNNVQFEFDKAEIIEPAYDELNSLAAIMMEYEDLSIDIAARADERGSESYNENLSMRRAESVKNYLVEQGVNASRITTSALGESDPLMSGNSSTAYAQNRSVQVTLSYDGDN